MTGSKYCKQEGLDSLVELSIISGVSRATLNDWWHTKDKTFKCLVAGAVVIKLKQSLGALVWMNKD